MYIIKKIKGENVLFIVHLLSNELDVPIEEFKSAFPNCVDNWLGDIISSYYPIYQKVWIYGLDNNKGEKLVCKEYLETFWQIKSVYCKYHRERYLQILCSARLGRIGSKSKLKLLPDDLLRLMVNEFLGY